MALELPIPYFNIGALIFESLELAGVIPDPLDWILSFFSGRPTMQATVDIANDFIQEPSPVLKLLGYGATQAVKDDIPLSSPSADLIYGQYFYATVVMQSAIRWGSIDAYRTEFFTSRAEWQIKRGIST